MWGGKVNTIADIILSFHLCAYENATSLILISYEKYVVFMLLKKYLK